MRHERKKEGKKEKEAQLKPGQHIISQRNVCPIIKPLLKLNVLAFVEIDGLV